MSLRFNAIANISSETSGVPVPPSLKITGIFNENVFTIKTAREFLSDEGYKSLVTSIRGGKKIDRIVVVNVLDREVNAYTRRMVAKPLDTFGHHYLCQLGIQACFLGNIQKFKRSDHFSIGHHDTDKCFIFGNFLGSIVTNSLKIGDNAILFEGIFNDFVPYNILFMLFGETHRGDKREEKTFLILGMLEGYLPIFDGLFCGVVVACGD